MHDIKERPSLLGLFFLYFVIMHVDFKAILDKIINELVPLTQNSVQEGNKIFVIDVSVG